MRVKVENPPEHLEMNRCLLPLATVCFSLYCPCLEKQTRVIFYKTASWRTLVCSNITEVLNEIHSNTHNV